MESRRLHGRSDAVTGQNLPLVSHINQRNARVSIHYGDGTERNFGQVSVFPADAPAHRRRSPPDLRRGANVEFDRDGRRDPDRQAITPDEPATPKGLRHATPTEQPSTALVIGFDFYNQPLTEFDSRRPSSPRGSVFFYYLTAEDYREDRGLPDVDNAFSVAERRHRPLGDARGAGGQHQRPDRAGRHEPFQVWEGVHPVRSTTSTTPAAAMFNAVPRQRLKADSLNDSINDTNADWYGVQVKLGGMPWKTVAEILATPDARWQLLAFREFPTTTSSSSSGRARP